MTLTADALTPYLFLAPALVAARASSSSTRSSRSSTTASPTTTSSGRRSPSASTTTQKLLADDTFWLALDALVRLPARDADPDRALDRARDRRQPHAARDPHLPGAVLRARGQRQHRHRPRLALAVRPQRLHQQRPAVVGRHPRARSSGSPTPSLVLPIAMLLTIWAGVGYYSVIFLAGLQNIPEELYDAARIDGCNDFQKHRYVSMPGLRPQIVFVAVISSLAALKVFDEIYVLTNRTGGDPRQRRDDGLLPVAAGVRAQPRRATRRRSRSPCSRSRSCFSIVNVRLLERGQGRGMSGATARAGRVTPVDSRTRRAAGRARGADRWRDVGWYVVLTAIAVITVFPFVWMLLTSLKGPLDPITSVPPQFLPSDPTLANYAARLGRAADPDVLPEQRRSWRSRSGCSTCWSPRWPRIRWRRCGSRAGGDLLPAAGDADRAGPADLHPELRPGGQRLPLLRHAAGADLPEPRQRVQHLPAAPGVPRRAQRPASTRRGSTAPGSGGSGGRSCCRSSGRRSRRSRSSRSSRRGTTSCGRR